MPVTYPVVELIAAEIKTRLTTLVRNTTYNTRVSEVIRPTRLGNYTPKHLQIVLTQGGIEVSDEHSLPGNPNASARIQTFNIRCHVMTSETSAEPIDRICNMFEADVVRVVCVPAATWQTMDGNALDAWFEARESINADGGIDGFNLPLKVLYRYDENNPYEYRS